MRKPNKLKILKTAMIILASVIVCSQTGLIIAKCTGLISVSWWIVLLPLIIVLALAALSIAAITVALLIASGYIEEEMRDMN